jgi:hypothetical protein
MIQVFESKITPATLNEESWRGMFTLHDFVVKDYKRKIASCKAVYIPFDYLKFNNIPLHIFTDDYSFELGTTLDELIDEENNCIIETPRFMNILYIDQLKSWEAGAGAELLTRVIRQYIHPDNFTLFCLYAHPIHKDDSIDYVDAPTGDIEKIINYYKKNTFRSVDGKPQVMYFTR